MNPPGQVLAGTPYRFSEAVTEQVQQQLAELEQRMSGLRKSGLLTEQTLRHYYREKRFEQIAESNALEGSTLSVGETELAVTRGVTITGHAPQFIRDAVALDAALSRITELARRKDAPTDLLQLSEIHSLLLGDHPAAGSFRRERVAIRGSSHTPPKTWEAVMQQMEQWEQWSASNSGLPAPLRAAVLHAWLTHIHPWLDGNGRTARAAGNLELIRAGYPPIIIKRFERSRYLDALAESDQAGDLRLFLELILDRVHGALMRLERSARATQGIEPAVYQPLHHQQPLAVLETALRLLAESMQYRLAAALQNAGGRCRLTTFAEPLDADDYAELCAGRSVPKVWAFRIQLTKHGLPPYERLAWFGCRSAPMLEQLNQTGGPSLYWSARSPDAYPPWLEDEVHAPFAVELTTIAGEGDRWFVRLPDGVIQPFSATEIAHKVSAAMLLQAGMD